MNAQGLFSIGGIASGLDTAGIIEQLMAIERQPITRMENRQQQLERVDQAWQSINTRLSSLRTAIDAVRDPSAFSELISVGSSNTEVASVTKGSTPGTGSLTFHVDQLARAHQLASGTFASASDALNATGTLSVQVGTDAAVSIEVAATDSLQAVADKLNDLDAGATASVVKTAEGEHRLVMEAAATGTANTVQLTNGTGLTQFDGYDAATNPAGLRTLQAAQDARIRMGTGAEAIEITRSSNTIGDLVPGAEITLREVTTQTAADGTTSDGVPVTVSAERDVDGGVSAVRSYVDALNSVIRTVTELTAYDAETQSSGILQGDPYARQLLNQLRNSATAPLGVEAEPFAGAFAVGLSIDRDGQFTLDEEKLQAALAQDFEAVSRVFTRNATTSEPLVSGTIGTTDTAAGAYDIRVTAAGTAARAAGAIFGPDGPVEPKTFRISSGGRIATVTLDTSTMTSGQIVDAINAELEEQDIGSITASQDGDDLVLEESWYGADVAFTVEELDAAGDPVAAPTWFNATPYTGSDAAGEILIDGTWQTLDGSGQALSVASGTAEGLSFVWTGTDAIDPATPHTFGVTFTHGLAGNVDNVLQTLEGGSGLVARARQGITDQVDLFQNRIEAFERRLETREATLVRQFTAMEVALSKMQAQGNWLNSQLAGLNGMSPQ